MKIIVNGRDVSHQERFRIPMIDASYRISTRKLKKCINGNGFTVNGITFSNDFDGVPEFSQNGKAVPVNTLRKKEFRTFAEDLDLVAALHFLQLVSVDFRS